MKREIRTLSHTFYDCKYHIVFTPKYRGKAFESKYIKEEVRRILRLSFKWKGFEVVSGHVSIDYIHLILIILPKFLILYAMSILKGKSSTWIKKKNKNLELKCRKGSFWSRGYFVSIGIDELIIKRYVAHQDKHHQVNLQGKLF